jgi:biopolymer transport protein ExbD
MAGERPAAQKKKKRKRHHLVGGHGSQLSKAPMKTEINVTPLVDVVLVLLIIFMVVTPMLSRGVKVDLPETIHHEKKQDTGEQIVVSIAADGTVFVGSDPGKGEQIVTLVHKAMGTNMGREVHVKGDKSLEYGQVREVLELIHEAGASKVALGTEEKKAK